MLPLLTLAIVLLLLLNAFFALAEFAAVKTRTTWVEELERRRDPKARPIRHLHDHLDEYLSVVQVGITLTSIGLGYLGEPAMAAFLVPFVDEAGEAGSGWAHAAAITLGYVIISFLHVVLGELVPKGIAVRFSERAALWTAWPMRVFYVGFYLPRAVLHGAARLVLRLIGVRDPEFRETLSEDEIRSLLGVSQVRGLMSLRRLLMLENVLDLDGLKVTDAMRPRHQVATIATGGDVQAVLHRFRETHFSRYPLVDRDDRVVGILNIKSILHEIAGGTRPADVDRLARGAVYAREEMPLERVLADLQRRREQMAIVTDAQDRWTGIITMEDVLEELVGTLGDEYEMEKPVFLAEILAPERIVMELEAKTLRDGVRELASHAALAGEAFGGLGEVLLRREAVMSTYVGKGIAIPHARLSGLDRSLLLLGRSREGLQTDVVDQRAHLVFAVLTPTHLPGEHVRIVGRIAALTESDYLLGRLRDAASTEAVMEVLREGDPSVNPA